MLKQLLKPSHGRLRRGSNDVLARTPRKHKELICAKLGVPTHGRLEEDLDEKIRKHVHGDLTTEVTRILINIAFEQIDKAGDGLLSRIDVLTGVRRPLIREMLNMRSGEARTRAAPRLLCHTLHLPSLARRGLAWLLFSSPRI